ncbi:guanylate kinase [bacterium]|nr:guanylate kinase [bacterium]
MVCAETKTGLLIVISAPSGGGKTTLCDRLLAKHPEITRAVTCTTRAPRAGEQNGVHYYFLSRDIFLQKRDSGEFLEYANVYDNLYGTLRSEVLTRLMGGKHVLLNIDVQGAEAIRKKAANDPELQPRLLTVFLTPDSLTELTRRLKKRGTESEDVLAKRLSQASEELSHWNRFDYLIASTSADEDLRKMETILEAEMMRSTRVRPPAF